MMRIFGTILIASICISLSAKAETYKPGTIGYVYDSCEKSLASIKSAQEFQGTYCGRFFSGLMTGAITSNWILMGSAEGDPCQDDWKKAGDKIAERNCFEKNLLDAKLSKDKSLIPVFLFNEWIAYLDNTGLKAFVFEQPVTTMWRFFTKDNQLCKYINQNGFSNNQSLRVNSELLRDMQNYKFFDEPIVTYSEMYDGCKNDIEISKGSKQSFAATSCGAEILGYIAGLFSTKSLQDNRHYAENPSCKKRIDDLYKDLDVTQRSCIQEDMNVLKLGRVFLETIDALNLKNKREGKGKTTEKLPFGAVMPITGQFYDFCKRKFKFERLTP